MSAPPSHAPTPGKVIGSVRSTVSTGTVRAWLPTEQMMVHLWRLSCVLLRSVVQMLFKTCVLETVLKHSLKLPIRGAIGCVYYTRRCRSHVRTELFVGDVVLVLAFSCRERAR